MLKLLIRDWILFRYIALLFPFILLTIMGLVMADPEGFFILGPMIAIISPLFVFVNEDKNKGYILAASLPGDRLTILKARMLSIWILTAAVLLYITILAIVLQQVKPVTDGRYLTALNPRTLYVYLWVITATYALFIPLFIGFIGRGLYVAITIGLSLNVLLGISAFIRASQGGGLWMFEAVERLIRFGYASHHTLGQFLLSTLGLLGINAFTWYISKRLYLRREFI